jgi:hypothetical protein
MEILCKLTIGLIIRGATMDDMFIMHTQLISLNESAKTIQPYLIAVAAFAVGYMASTVRHGNTEKIRARHYALSLSIRAAFLYTSFSPMRPRK